ncbi:unnamed protein product, partial [marine sediment metagenome]
GNLNWSDEAQNDMMVRDLGKNGEVRNTSDINEVGESFKVDLKDT